MTYKMTQEDIDSVKKWAENNLKQGKNAAEERRRDFSKLKCVELRKYIKDYLKDDPNGVSGLSKWKKQAMIDFIDDLLDTAVKHHAEF